MLINRIVKLRRRSVRLLAGPVGGGVEESFRALEHPPWASVGVLAGKVACALFFALTLSFCFQGRVVACLIEKIPMPLVIVIRPWRCKRDTSR